jgi:hypothetical protein
MVFFCIGNLPRFLELHKDYTVNIDSFKNAWKDMDSPHDFGLIFGLLLVNKFNLELQKDRASKSFLLYSKLGYPTVILSMTAMNSSGENLKYIDMPGPLFIVADNIYLSPGTWKLSPDSSNPLGHNGVRSCLLYRPKINLLWLGVGEGQLKQPIKLWKDLDYVNDIYRPLDDYITHPMGDTHHLIVLVVSIAMAQTFDHEVACDDLLHWYAVWKNKYEHIYKNNIMNIQASIKGGKSFKELLKKIDFI